MPAIAGGDKQNSVISKKSFHRELQPKTIICEAQAKMLDYFETKWRIRKLFKRKRA